MHSINLNLDEVSQDPSHNLVVQSIADIPDTEPKAVINTRLTEDIAVLPLPGINTGLEVETEDNRTNKTRDKSNKTLMLCSFAIHAMGIAALASQSARHIPNILSKPEEIIPVQATLYYPPIPKLIEVPAESPEALETVPIKTVPTEIPVAELQNNTLEKNQQPLAQTVTESEKATVSDAAITEPTEQPPEVAVTNENPITESAVEPTAQQVTGNRLERLNQALSSHLNRINTQQMQAMSEAATANRQQQFYQQQTQGYQLPQAEPEMKIKK
ncbi:hypothetical protein [Planctobacterium marinum]|uniref:Uncharacterized protein n=1 Tax=Planctobacterium marinum TaxID=1631968 RepID=A0AA48HT29_9ALTE|nr:hypothetical protein MACH26_08440 [Planctobacterium marinum]